MIGTCAELEGAIRSGRLDESFARLYGEPLMANQKWRYLRLLAKRTGTGATEEGAIMVSSPGRTELGGNHTDHNHGNVLVAAVDLDCVAAVTPEVAPLVELISEGFPRPIRVDLRNLEPIAIEEGTPEALVRGVAASFSAAGGEIRGFRGVVQATCIPGTGLSSSAAFAVMIGAVFSLIESHNSRTAEQLAQMARTAENRFFGKPCGLMDQMASAVGGVLAIDFLDPEKPRLHHLSSALRMDGYQMVVVDTGGSHVKLTEEYGAVPKEMRAAALALGSHVGRGLTVAELLAKLPEIRRQAGDRAALRLLHFIEENDRVRAMTTALEANRFSDYLELVRASGESSALLLQNCASQSTTREQGILLALALTRRFCADAVARVHGGGFAGAIQAYVPEDSLGRYTRKMEEVFGRGTVIPLVIGRPGVRGVARDGLLPLPQATPVR
jgi:galactokinase